MHNSTNSPVTASQGSIINLSFTSEQDARNQADSIRNICTAQINADNAAKANLRVSSQNNLYVLLGTFCELSFKFLDPMNANFLSVVLGDYGLQPAPAGVNPFRPLSDMLFGEWVREIINYEETKSAALPSSELQKVKAKTRKAPPGTTATRTVNGEKWFFVPNRSAEKYAKVARYAKSQGWEPQYVAQNIADFKGKMDGVVKADTAATRGTDAKEIETQELVDLVMAREPHSKLDTSECGFGPEDKKRELVCLWAEVEGDEVLIRGLMPTSQDAIKAYLRKYANDNAAQLWKEQAKGNKTAEA
ncbi:hypothetical protein [Sphingobium bisphenolivorans]|uniref:hypothetical protein n=1 Tax=Sphingobium bisphenolivorans TaxID=1335760 RepID=UPI0003B6FF94|nr:hypothetical protein [Sphingobium bisphenolivorans]